MKIVYPILIVEHQKDFLVYVPDFDIYTEGKSVADAIEMARDAIGLKGIDYEDDGKDLPDASTYAEAIELAKKDVEIFDYSKGIATMVDVNLTEYRKRHEHRMVKKNCTIPYYLNVKAEKEGINFSQLLQEALQKKLGLLK